MSLRNNIRGRLGEEDAAAFLKAKGFRILERNYRYERGEIDIIAEDKAELVFVEVKTRYSTKFGEPEDAVAYHKQAQLRKAAEGYLTAHELVDKFCRFDVIAILIEEGRKHIRHIENAF